MRILRTPPPPPRLPHPRPPSCHPAPSSVPIAVARRRGTEINEDPVPVDCPLESLPLEIRDQILSLLDLQQLRSLVHASPVFHAYYRRQRMSLLHMCLETSLASSLFDPTAVPIVGDQNWSYHYGGRWRLYEDWRPRVLAALQSKRFTRLEVIDTATFFSYFVAPLARSYAAYKRAVGSAAVVVETTLEHGRLHDDQRIAELCTGSSSSSNSNDAQEKLEDFASYLHHFYLARYVWSDYYGTGFMKKALRREKSLHLKPTYPSNIMVFDSD